MIACYIREEVGQYVEHDDCARLSEKEAVRYQDVRQGSSTSGGGR